MWRSIPINVATPLIVETGLYSKGYARWTLSYRRGFTLWSQEAEYESRFLQKSAPTISFILPGFVENALPYILSNFGENRCRRFWENWGIPQKFPSNISRTVWATTFKLGNLEQNIDPYTCYFFQNFRTRGWGTRSPPIFEKIGGG